MSESKSNHGLKLAKTFFAATKDASIKAVTKIGKRLHIKRFENKDTQGKSVEIVLGDLSLYYKRIAVFASYDPEGKINDAVISYLQALQSVVDGIVFVTDNFILPTEIDKIKNLVVYAQCSRHNEYDFGSYKRGVKWLEKTGLINKIEELVLCNDSCYAPIYPFKPMFEEMDRRQCDFWGICANDEFQYHIQSYFWVLKKSAFQSTVFKRYINSIKHQDDITAIIKNYEVTLADRFMREGLVVDSYIPNYFNSGVYPYYVHNLTLCPVWLIKQGCPLIKKKALLDESFNLEGIYNTIQYLKEHHNELLEKVAYVDVGNPNEEYDYRFSIIMPVYNCRAMVSPVIDRVLNQSYQKFELIIMDDGSEDGTFEYLNEQYGHEIETGKIRLVRTEHNGVSGARNAGLKETKNNWIAYVDCNTFVIGDFLRIFCQAIAANPDTLLFYGKAKEIHSDEIIGKPFNYKKLKKSYYIHLGAFVHHKNIYNEKGGCDESATCLGDGDLIVRYTENNKVSFIDRVVLFYHGNHDYSGKAIDSKWQDNYAGCLKNRSLSHSVTALVSKWQEKYADFMNKRK